jgi:hypothetical protein
MVFEAVLFLAGAILFLLAVVFFVYLWQDRLALMRRREALQVEVALLKEQRVDLDIMERELLVWAQGLEHQQHAIAEAEEELRMLTATKRYADDLSVGAAPGTAALLDPVAADALKSVTKNVKQHTVSPKLQEKPQ